MSSMISVWEKLECLIVDAIVLKNNAKLIVNFLYQVKLVRLD